VCDLSHPKFKKLVELEGYDDEVKFLTEACGDSICPASLHRSGKRRVRSSGWAAAAGL
jgi:hypothetical protein